MSAQITIDTDGTWLVPDNPKIACIQGDGIGTDIWPGVRMVLDAAVVSVFGHQKQIDWVPVRAGENSFRYNGRWLPEETLETIQSLKVAMKGPLATPVGKGIRSLNVQIRRHLDLYACIRPVRYYRRCPAR